jgi:DNA-binding transcriptional ArsR family regulator
MPAVLPMLTEQHLGKLSRTFKMFSDENRLAICQLLAAERKAMDQSLMLQKLADQQRPIAQQTLSWHLRELARAEIVVIQKAGRHRVYYLNPTTINETLLFIHNLSPEELSNARPETNN